MVAPACRATRLAVPTAFAFALAVALALLHVGRAAVPVARQQAGARHHEDTHATAVTCDVTGVWIDEADGTPATVTQVGHSLTATAGTGGPAVLTPEWASANGTIDGHTITMTFTTEGKPAPALTGLVFRLCDRISWSNGATWLLQRTEIKTVDLVFMTHLDVGFTNLARNVCDLYYDSHFVHAMETSNGLRNGSIPGTEAKFVYTTHPWLLLEHQDYAVQCAHRPRTAAEIAAVDAAIARGDIGWHGKPFNLLVELADADLFDSGLALAQQLNAKYNTTWGSVTAKSTDVPGLSRSAVPLLSARGIKALHIGYNGACLVPDIPPVFLWKDLATGTELVTMVELGYGKQIVVPSIERALVFMYSMDNGPPPTAKAVDAYWKSVQARFPNAKVRASSLDAFGAALAADDVKATLPVITSEIGQSWNYGAPADPYKNAAFREIRRATLEAVAAGDLPKDDPSLMAFERRVMLSPEHNWGLSIGQYEAAARTPTGNWSNAQFMPVMHRKDWEFIESGWSEERGFLMPVTASASAPTPSAQWTAFEGVMADRVKALTPVVPDLSAFETAKAGTLYSAAGFTVSLRGSDGAIDVLRDASTGRNWAASDAPLGALTYQTFTLDDFNTFNEGYNPHCGPPCPDFSKAGMDAAKPESALWFPTVTGMYKNGASLAEAEAAAGSATASSRATFIVELELPAATHTMYGAPEKVFVNFTLVPGAVPGSGSLLVGVQWFNKTVTRLSEAMHLTLSPVVDSPELWRLDVMGRPIDPLDVVVNGTRHLHAVWEGASYVDGITGTNVTVAALDTPMVQVGGKAGDHILLYDGQAEPDMAGGLHWNLHNNLWGTAFPQFYGDDAAFRFRVDMAGPHQ